MRALALLALPTLAACSISLDFEADGDVDFAIGDIGDNCDIDQETVPDECTATGTREGDGCRLEATCSDLTLIDVEEVRTDISESTNNNGNITTRIEAISLRATNIVWNNFNATPLPDGTTATLEVRYGALDEDGGTTDTQLFFLDEAQYATLVSDPTSLGPILSVPADGVRWDDDPFLFTLNTVLDDDGAELPVTATVNLFVPDLAAVQNASGTTGRLSFEAEITGTGGISLRNNNN
ncbi:MAG: hypothetical protein AAF602_27200 [Myxococcota bacterium]